MAGRAIIAALVVSLAWGVLSGSAWAAVSPRFSAPVLRMDARSFEPVGPVAADLNGDGKADLATADGHRLSVLFGKGDGTFHGSVDYRTTIGEALDIEVADANGDARPDLLVLGNDRKRLLVAVFVNDGAGRFRRDRVYAVGDMSGLETAFAAGDISGDGIVDVVVAGSDWDFAMLLGTGGGQLAPVRTVSGPGSSDVDLADFNLDGKLDAAVTSYGRRPVRLRLGNGDGTFGPAQGFGEGDTISEDVTVVADFNQDGKLDLAVTLAEARRTERLTLYFGNGDGTFGSRSPVPFGFGSPTVADLNRDGNPDLVRFEAFRSVVHSGIGNGAFGARELGFRISALYIAGAAVADFNGDAWPDLVSLAYNDQGEFGGQTLGTEVLLNWTGLPAPPCVVVPVSHRRLRAATRDLRRAGCRVGHVSSRHSQKPGKNRVISQRPRYGVVLPSRARVNLVVSRGPRR